MSFALLNENKNESKSELFKSYKVLFEDWGNYMYHLYDKDHAKHFTYAMRTDKNFDFTNLIKADIKTFLAALSGNANKHLFSFMYENFFDSLLFDFRLISFSHEISIFHVEKHSQEIIHSCERG